VWIYVVNRAERAADCIVPAYGKISAGCGPNLNEDFADCGWPVVIKVKPGVRVDDFVQHLRDLAAVVEANAPPDKVFESGDPADRLHAFGTTFQALEMPDDAASAAEAVAK
jgi:hypothetical protein